MTRHRILSALLCAATLSACDKNAPRELLGPAPQAQIKFFNFGVNSPNVNFWGDTVKLTAIGSATGVEATTGTKYGDPAAGGYYVSVTPGSHVFTGRITATTDHNLVVSSVTRAVENGKFYSYYESGFYNTTTKTVDAFILEDTLTGIDVSKAKVRFVNAISNGTSPFVLYAKNTVSGVETAVGGPTAYKSATSFVPVDSAVYDLSVRYSGSSTDLFTRTGVSWNPGRIYTVTARGDITVTSTTATNRPQLDNTANM